MSAATIDSGPRGPLAGVRVLDLATERAELAGRTLADLGAEVIKVEPPEGAAARRLPPFDGRRPDESLYWAAVALGKRSVVLDLSDEGDRGRLRGLVESADILIESFDPGVMASLGLDDAALRALNPGLIYVSVTPYGQSGPDASSPASELTLEAAGGLLGLQGDGDRPPVPVGYPQAAFHSGVQAAADAVIALNERDRSGLGQHLDVSMQAAMVWTLMNATGFPPNTGGDPPNTGAQRAGAPQTPVPGLRAPRVVECADGYMLATLVGAAARTAPTWELALRWIDEERGLDDELRRVDWSDWAAAALDGRLDVAVAQRALDEILAHSRGKTKRELLDWASAHRLLVAPVNTVADLLADPQLRARDYWQDVGDRVHPGPPALMPRTPLRLRGPAPARGEGQSLLDGPPPARRWAATGEARGDAFAGVRVADFAWVGVGPMTSKALADHGATVVHVESASRPDVLRAAPPFKDNEPGLDRAQFMANFNTSKLGLALDLSTERGRTLARRLVDWADVVVESFTPGTMQRLGLDYATVSAGRPELIMLSTCLRGQTGPDASYRGFGGQGSALSGLHALTGWPDRPPSGTWGAYTDFIAPRYCVAALASAVYERRRSGLGQHIDVSQVEAGMHFIEPLLLDYTVNGRVAGAAGHDSDRACPHGVYRTAGVERYVAIAVETTAQWRALSTVAPLDAFAEGMCDELHERISRRDAIDGTLRTWAAEREPWELAETLKRAGVPASVVLRPSDLYRDPQLSHRGFFVTLDHTVMGPTPYDGPVTHFSEGPARLRKAAPALGENNDYVLRKLLGLSADEVAEAAAAGVLA